MCAGPPVLVPARVLRRDFEDRRHGMTSFSISCSLPSNADARFPPRRRTITNLEEIRACEIRNKPGVPFMCRNGTTSEPFRHHGWESGGSRPSSRVRYRSVAGGSKDRRRAGSWERLPVSGGVAHKGLARRRQGARRGSMRAIVPDEQRGIRPQSPCARRVPAARGRLRRCRSSEVGRSRSSRRLESTPAARGTRPLP